MAVKLTDTFDSVELDIIRSALMSWANANDKLLASGMKQYDDHERDSQKKYGEIIDEMLMKLEDVINDKYYP